MILLYFDELETGDIINIPRIGLARFTEARVNRGFAGEPEGLRYYFSELGSNRFVASIPDSGCYEPILWFSPL